MDNGCAQLCVAGDIISEYEVFSNQDFNVGQHILRESLENLSKRAAFCSGIDAAEYHNVCTNIAISLL